MKDVKLKCIYSGPMRGDCCSHNKYEPTEPTTVRELCEYIISDKGEWGYVGIKASINGLRYIFGDPCIEYAYGEYKEPLESKFSQEILDSYVELIDWDGGWSRADWEFTLKQNENKMEEDEADDCPGITTLNDELKSVNDPDFQLGLEGTEPDDKDTNVYGSKIKDVKRIRELEELVETLYTKIGRLTMELEKRSK